MAACARAANKIVLIDGRFLRCHGRIVENLIEKDLKLESKEDIERYGIRKFNDECAASVMKYAGDWRTVVERTGRWVDMDHDYKTMDLSYMETVWWIFSEIWKKGLVYEGFKAVPYCFRCSTPLSNFEANQGYRDRQDQTVTVKFRLSDQPDTFVLAWTTTPWTLPSNLAICLHPEIDYAVVKTGGEYLILAANLIEVIKTKTGLLDMIPDERHLKELPHYDKSE
jgi:isoleucyl-tRNA synthetase